MAISSIWTLSGPQSGPLADLGVIDATLRFVSADVDTLDLTFSDQAHAATGWTYGAAVTLKRSGATFFRGTVAAPQRRRGAVAGDSRTVRIEGPWARLARLPYAQRFLHFNGSSVGESPEHPRAILGQSSEGLITLTAQAFSEILDYAAAHGAGLSAGNLPATRKIPLLQTYSRSCADILRELLRWHYDCVAWIDYSTMRLNIQPRSTLPEWTCDATGRPLSSLDLARRDDLVPTNVIISYETVVDDPNYDDDLALDTQPVATDLKRRLQIYRDTAGGTAIQVGTLVGVMPVNLPNATQPANETQEIVTRPIPKAGDYDRAAENWWIDHSNLHRWGLDRDDIILPRRTVGDIYAHSVRAIPLPITEDDTPLPYYWTDDIDRLPRELVSGQVKPWMRRSYGRVRARVTIGIKKASIDNLSAEFHFEAARAVRSYTVDIDGSEAYLFDVAVEVAATNAATKTYSHPTSASGIAIPSQDIQTRPNLNSTKTHLAADYYDTSPAIADQIIPGLANTIYKALSTPDWEGSLSLTEQEAGARRYLGQVINISHAARPEWSTMGARVQTETLNLANGETSLALGGPAQLSIQDFAELLRALRAPLQRQLLIAGGGSRTTDDADAKWTTGSASLLDYSGAGSDSNRFDIPPPSGRSRWDLKPDLDTQRWRLVPGRIYNGTSIVTIKDVDQDIEPEDGKSLYLWSDSLGGDEWTLKYETTPTPKYQFSDGEFDEVRKILCTFYGSTTDQAVAVGDLWVRWEVSDADLTTVISAWMDPATSRASSVIDLLPQ